MALKTATKSEKLSRAKSYKSAALAAIYEAASDLHEAGLVDLKTMRDFNKSCLTEIKSMTPKRIRAIRLRENASQPVFALYLNVSPGVISQWERGEKKPAGSSLKLLALVDKKGLEFIA